MAKDCKQKVVKFVALQFLTFQPVILTNVIPFVGIGIWEHLTSAFFSSTIKNLALILSFDILILILFCCLLICFLIAFTIGTSYTDILKQLHGSFSRYSVGIFLIEKMILAGFCLPKANTTSWVAGWLSPLLFGYLLFCKFKHRYGSEKLFDFVQVIGTLVLLTFSLMNLLTPWSLSTGDSIFSYGLLLVIPIFASVVFFHKKHSLTNIQLFPTFTHRNKHQIIESIKYMVHIAKSVNKDHRYYLYHLLNQFLLFDSRKDSFSERFQSRKITLEFQSQDFIISSEKILEKIFCYVDHLLVNSQKVSHYDRRPLIEFLILYHLAHTDRISQCLQLFYDNPDKEETRQSFSMKYWHFKISKKMSKRILLLESDKLSNHVQLNIDEMVCYDKLCLELKHNMFESIEICVKFWTDLKEPVPKIHPLTDGILKLKNRSSKIENLIRQASKINQSLILHLQIYFHFADSILFDKVKKSKAKDILRDLLYHKVHDNKFDQFVSFTGPEFDGFFFVVTSEKHRFGIIEYASPQSCLFVNSTLSNILQRPLDSLKPSFAKRHLNKSLFNAISSQNNQTNQWKFFEPFIDFYLDENRFLKMTTTNYQIFPNLANGLKMVVKSMPVNMPEIARGGIALVNMMTGSIIEYSVGLSNLLRQMLKETFQGRQLKAADLSHLGNYFSLFLDSETTDQLLNGKNIQVSFKLNSNELIHLSRNFKMANALDFVKSPHNYEVSVEAANRDASSPHLTNSLEPSETEFVISNILVKASLLLKLEQEYSDFALLRFSIVSRDQEAELLISTSQISASSFKHLKPDTKAKKREIQTTIFDANASEFREPKQFNVSFYVVGLLLVLVVKLVLSLFIHSNSNSHINYSDVVIKEALYANRSIIRCISIFDNLSLVVAEEMIKAGVPGFEYDASVLKQEILTDLQAMKENEIEYTTLINYYFDNSQFERLYSITSTSSIATEMGSLLYFQQVQVFKNDLIPVTISFNEFGFYFIQSVQYLIQAKDFPNFILLKSTLDTLLIRLDELTNQFLEENQLNFASYEQISNLLRIVNIVLLIAYLAVYAMIAIKDEWKLYDAMLNMCNISKVEISQMMRHLSDLKVTQAGGSIKKVKKLCQKMRKNTLKMPINDPHQNSSKHISVLNDSYEEKLYHQHNAHPRKQKTSFHDQHYHKSTEKYAIRMDMAKRQAKLGMKKSLILPFLVLLLVIVIELITTTIVSTASQQISTYSSSFALINNVCSQSHRMRFYTFSFVFDTACSSCIPNFFSLKNSQLENLQEIKKQLTGSWISGMNDFLEMFAVINNDFCNYSPLSESQKVDFKELCQQSQILQKGLETLMINVGEQQTSLLNNLSLLSDVAFVNKISLVQITLSIVLKFVLEEMIRAVEKGHNSCMLYINLSLSVSWISALLLGGYLIFTIRRKINGIIWVRAWCINLLKSSDFRSNSRIQAYLSKNGKAEESVTN